MAVLAAAPAEQVTALPNILSLTLPTSSVTALAAAAAIIFIMMPSVSPTINAMVRAWEEATAVMAVIGMAPLAAIMAAAMVVLLLPILKQLQHKMEEQLPFMVLAVVEEARLIACSLAVKPVPAVRVIKGLYIFACQESRIQPQFKR